MNTRLLMALSATFMAALGLAGSFLPLALLTSMEVPPTTVLVVLVQVTGALYLGFAVLNWMARGVLIGGIYSRPLAMGNFLHFAVVGATLVKAMTTIDLSIVYVMAAVYVVFAVWFALVLFTHPVQKTCKEATQ